MAGLAALLLATAGSGSGATTPTPGAGGVAYFAEEAQAAPNYIFPFMNVDFYSTTNVAQFQYLMFRPLYWFGTGGQPTLNRSLSLAAPPAYSRGGTVTITLKPYKWSDGESVTSQDVLFWMNMYKVEKLGYAGYAPGTMPDDVKAVRVDGPTRLTFTLTGPVNPSWYTYDELSQITPLPMAWDIAATGQKIGSGACAKAAYASVTVKVAKTAKGETVTPVSASAKSCAAVYTYLSKAAGFDPTNPKAPNTALGTYATNPLWQVVDGPWHLTSFSSAGQVTMQPNPSYSGPVKPRLAEFVELPFTSTAAEFDALVGGKVTVGYLPPEDVTSPAQNPTTPGANNPRVAGRFDLVPWYPWGVNYFWPNYNSAGDGGQAGKIFQQLYFRQALQSLVDQPLSIEKIYKNYAVPTYGPVPVLPRNSFASPGETSNPYPYDPAKARHLLSANGWKVVPGGVSTCLDAAKCGVPAGTPLSFTLQYVNTGAAEQALMQAEQASWAQVGIKMSLTTAALDTVIANAAPCSGSSCTWEFENWGGGWDYSPDFYPSGEETFQTGAGANNGSYSSNVDDKLITATDFGVAGLTRYEDYLAKSLPAVWQPNPAYAITEYAKNLKGVMPQNPLLAITPENWSFGS